MCVHICASVGMNESGRKGTPGGRCRRSTGSEVGSSIEHGGDKEALEFARGKLVHIVEDEVAFHPEEARNPQASEAS